MSLHAGRTALLGLVIFFSGFIADGHAKDSSFATIARGRYLVTAGDCIACHTTKGGKPFAGGRPIETPFGVIYSPNLTPDPETGIGNWSDEDFYNALHSGTGPDGKLLYPAFPYPFFTKLARSDVMAIRAFLDTLEPVKNARPDPELMWPLGYRFLLNGWNWMFFDEGVYQQNPHKSAEWNRGAYLVKALEHCGACHTPKNFAGAGKTDAAFRGGRLQDWFAPDITGTEHAGIAAWSTDDLIEFLKTGRNKFSGATGLMAEVVAHSTSKLTDDDLHAIAVYVKDLAGGSRENPETPDQTVMNAGHAIFRDSCSGCHQINGKGVPRMFPPLVHNANVQSDDPTTILRIILDGARTVPTDARPTPSTMPAFNWKLDDAEIAAVATYIRNSWGNSASSVTADQVGSLRERLQASTH